MPQLDLSTFPSQIFWLMVCFGILCFAVVVYLAPNMGKSLEQRQEKLTTLRESAEKFLKEAQDLSRHNEMTLETAHKEAAANLQKIISELTHFKDQKLLEFDRKSHEKLHEIHQTLTQEKNTILNETDHLLTHLIQDIFVRLTGQELSEAQIHQALKNRQNSLLEKDTPHA